LTGESVFSQLLVLFSLITVQVFQQTDHNKGRPTKNNRSLIIFGQDRQPPNPSSHLKCDRQSSDAARESRSLRVWESESTRIKGSSRIRDSLVKWADNVCWLTATCKSRKRIPYTPAHLSVGPDSLAASSGHLSPTCPTCNNKHWDQFLSWSKTSNIDHTWRTVKGPFLYFKDQVLAYGSGSVCERVLW